jgi:hypothetical protein
MLLVQRWILYCRNLGSPRVKLSFFAQQFFLNKSSLKVVLHDPRFRRTQTADAEAACVNRELYSPPPPPFHQLKQWDTGKQYSTRRRKESPSVIVAHMAWVVRKWTC